MCVCVCVCAVSIVPPRFWREGVYEMVCSRVERVREGRGVGMMEPLRAVVFSCSRLFLLDKEGKGPEGSIDTCEE